MGEDLSSSQERGDWGEESTLHLSVFNSVFDRKACCPDWVIQIPSVLLLLLAPLLAHVQGWCSMEWPGGLSLPPPQVHRNLSVPQGQEGTVEEVQQILSPALCFDGC